ncbi:Dual specificity protein phosphatase MPK-4 [Paramyrothecium foliicola]|nr:Dual specificity protein phosphatase MPK-4 [Paramyrothecium foliicola]
MGVPLVTIGKELQSSNGDTDEAIVIDVVAIVFNAQDALSLELRSFIEESCKALVDSEIGETGGLRYSYSVWLENEASLFVNPTETQANPETDSAYFTAFIAWDKLQYNSQHAKNLLEDLRASLSTHNLSPNLSTKAVQLIPRGASRECSRNVVNLAVQARQALTQSIIDARAHRRLFPAPSGRFVPQGELHEGNNRMFMNGQSRPEPFYGYHVVDVVWLRLKRGEVRAKNPRIYARLCDQIENVIGRLTGFIQAFCAYDVEDKTILAILTVWDDQDARTTSFREYRQFLEDFATSSIHLAGPLRHQAFQMARSSTDYLWLNSCNFIELISFRIPDEVLEHQLFECAYASFEHLPDNSLFFLADMSGLEIVGVALGAAAFAGQMMHMWRKRKAYKESPFTEKGPATAPLQLIESAAKYQNGGGIVVSQRSRSMVIPNSNDEAIRTGFQQMGNVGVAAVQLAQQMHSTHTKDQAVMRKSYDEATKTVFLEMGNVFRAVLQDSRQSQLQHREDQRRFGQIIVSMAIMAGPLLYLLGYYYAQASMLRTWQGWGISPEAGLPDSLAAERIEPTLFASLVSLITATIRGYLLIPVMLPFAGLASVLQILSSCLAHAFSFVFGLFSSIAHIFVSSVASQQLDPTYNTLAVSLAVIIKIVVSTVVSVGLWPAKFIFQFLSTLLRVSGIPPGAINSITPARSVQTLQQHGITHVLSLTNKKYRPRINEDSGIQQLHLLIEDNPYEDLLIVLDDLCDWIEHALSSGKVLVHCLQGISRSGAVIIAYLMRKLYIDYGPALGLAKKARFIIAPNSGFVEQLVLWQQYGHTIYDGKEDGVPKIKPEYKEWKANRGILLSKADAERQEEIRKNMSDAIIQLRRVPILNMGSCLSTEDDAPGARPARQQPTANPEKSLQVTWKADHVWAASREALWNLAVGSNTQEDYRAVSQNLLFTQARQWVDQEYAECARAGTIEDMNEVAIPMPDGSKFRFPMRLLVALDEHFTGIVYAATVIIAPPLEGDDSPWVKAGGAINAPEMEAARRRMLGLLLDIGQTGVNVKHAMVHIFMGADLITCRLDASSKQPTMVTIRTKPPGPFQEFNQNMADQARKKPEEFRGLFYRMLFMGHMERREREFPGATNWDEGAFPVLIDGSAHPWPTRLIVTRQHDKMSQDVDADIFKIRSPTDATGERSVKLLRNTDPSKDPGGIVSITLFITVGERLVWPECGTYVDSAAFKAAEKALVKHIQLLHRQGKLARCSINIVMGADEKVIKFFGDTIPAPDTAGEPAIKDRFKVKDLNAFNLTMEPLPKHSLFDSESHFQAIKHEMLARSQANPERYDNMASQIGIQAAKGILAMNFPGCEVSHEGELLATLPNGSTTTINDAHLIVARDPKQDPKSIVAVILSIARPSPDHHVFEATPKNWLGTEEMARAEEQLLILSKQWYKEEKISEKDCMAQVVMGMDCTIYQFVEGERFVDYSDERMAQFTWG